jgi:hypothetical protein
MRLRSHEHTSYLPLAILLLIVSFPLTVFTSYAATPYTGPEAGSIGLTGTVPADPPTVAAVIQSPAIGQRFSISPVKVSGTCPKDTLVEIFKNDIFAGSTPCTDAGTFSLDVDLLIGQNVLIARVYDALNQPGPDSNAVTVFYDAVPPQGSPLTPLNLGGAQIILNTDAVFRGVFPGKELVVPIDIVGGTPPYAINIQWGDGTNKVVPRGDNATFRVAHTYQKPGVYQMSIQATDSGGRVAFLTVAVIVNGQPSVTASGSTSAPSAGMINKLLILWPLYVASVAVLVSFWLGERREKQLLKDRGLLLSS